MLVAPVAAAFAFSRSSLFASLSKANTLPLPPIKAAKHHPAVTQETHPMRTGKWLKLMLRF
jgi:hypothetical protein